MIDIHTRGRRCAAMVLVSAASLAAHAGGTNSWLMPVSGSWNNGPNWSQGTVPNMSSDVLLGLSGPYTVSSAGSIQAGTLEISNADATLHIDNAQTFDLFGDLFNDGSIIVNPFSGGSATQFDFEADAFITGSGEIRLNSFGSRAQIRSGAGISVTHGDAHAIRGWGEIDAMLINNGTIEADIPSQALTLLTEDKVNNALVRAGNGALIQISGIAVSQGAGGMVEADGANSITDFSSATLADGSMQTTNGGLIRVINSAFDGVDFMQGQLQVPNARTMEVFNSITNNGTITVNPGGGGAATQIDFENSGSFLGSGEVVLDSFATRARLRTETGATMTNSANHTIRGWGQVEADLINNGLVSADVSGQELFMNTRQKVNNDLMQAVGGGILDFGGIGVAQGPGGQILADGADSRIDFNSTSITGGQINATGGGRVEVLSASFDGVTVSGPVNVQNARTLTVFNSIVNNGSITVNPGGGGSATQLDFGNSGSFLGNGEVILDSFDSRSRLRTASGHTMTNSATHTIRGFGQIEAALINNGLVSAEVPSTQILFNTFDQVNNSTMRAINAGALDFTGISVDQTGGGELVADGLDSRIELNGPTIVGGDIMTTNGARVDSFSNTFVDGVSFSGDMFVNNASTLRILNSIANDGHITVNPGGGGSATQVLFTTDGAFNGNGSVQLDSFGTRARIQTAPGVTAVNGANHTIFGFGQIEAALINNGLIRADVIGNELFLNSNPMENNGEILAVNESVIDIAGITLSQGPGGQINANGANTRIDLNTATISDGQLSASSGGRVDVSGVSTLDAVAVDAPLNVLNAGTLNIRNGVTNDQIITINPGGGGSATQLVWLDDSELAGTGTVRLDSFSIRSRLLVGGDATTATLGENQRLEGIGSIDAPLTHEGATAPGIGIGTMFASQPLTYTDSSVFEAEVNANNADLLDSSSSIALDGTLQVVYADGFAPSGFWSRKIIEGAGISGRFDDVLAPPAAVGLVTKVLYTATEVLVGQTCPSDVNLDGMLNFFDVSNFISGVSSQDPSADINGDGMVNFFDISAFLNNFSGGCSL